MSSDQSSTPKSPILLAIGISCAIALGSVVATLDYVQVEDIATGQFLTRPLAEGQAQNATAISRLEHTVGAISKDIDFVTERVSTSIRRNESQTVERLASLEGEIAKLKDKLTGIQHARVAPHARAAEPVQDVSGLRTSLHELTTAHTGAVTAITKRLERIEVMVGLTTDLTSSVADPAAKKATRRAETAKQAKKQPPVAEPAAPAAPLIQHNANTARPERGYLFNIKPVSQQGAPLRVSRLPG
jgi:hypothetical protein